MYLPIAIDHPASYMLNPSGSSPCPAAAVGPVVTKIGYLIV